MFNKRRIRKMNDMKMKKIRLRAADVQLTSAAINEEKEKSIGKRIDQSKRPEIEHKQGQKVAGQKQPQASNEKLPKIKTDHLTLCQNIFDYYAFLGLFFGIVCRYDWNRYRHCFFWFTNFLLIAANFCIGYTAYIYYQHDMTIKILEPFAVSGVAITCTLKWGVFLKYTNNLLAIMFAVKKICEETTTGDRVDVIIASLKKTYSLLRALAAALTVVMLFFVSIPLKFFFVDDIYYPLLPIVVPFFQQDTLKGYLCTTFFQSVLGVYSGISTLMYVKLCAAGTRFYQKSLTYRKRQ
ncbi:uncharacterized protein LOC119075727 [Bradysia coprophila]|uniref:uncharacterized protein LOC119075727 n=1 Tax=Bradysia coprophila TaxID=38358 RepID=UPI00187DD5E7|nr:uncharacterized protein LOC119075727 [Bradysia coprophila]